MVQSPKAKTQKPRYLWIGRELSGPVQLWGFLMEGQCDFMVMFDFKADSAGFCWDLNGDFTGFHSDLNGDCMGSHPV